MSDRRNNLGGVAAPRLVRCSSFIGRVQKDLRQLELNGIKCAGLAECYHRLNRQCDILMHGILCSKTLKLGEKEWRKIASEMSSSLRQGRQNSRINLLKKLPKAKGKRLGLKVRNLNLSCRQPVLRGNPKSVGFNPKALLFLFLFVGQLGCVLGGDNISAVLVHMSGNYPSGSEPRKYSAHEDVVHTSGRSLEEIEHEIQYWGVGGLVSGLCAGFIFGAYFGQKSSSNSLANSFYS